MPSTVAEGEKRHKVVIKDKNRHKNSYKSISFSERLLSKQMTD